MSNHFSEQMTAQTEKFVKDFGYFISLPNEVAIEFVEEVLHWKEDEIPGYELVFCRTVLRSDSSIEDLCIKKFPKIKIISLMLHLYFKEKDILSEFERNIFPTEDGEIFSLCFNGEDFEVFEIEPTERLNFGTLIFHQCA